MNVDVGLYKYFRGFREGHKLQFRAEMFGATNTPHFATPTVSVMSQSFGRISSTYNPFNYEGASRNDSAARIIQFESFGAAGERR